LATSQGLQLLHHFLLSINGILSVGDEDNGDGGFFGDGHQSIFESFKGSEDVGHASTMLFEVFRKDSVLLNLSLVAEGDQKLCAFGDTLIPKFDHSLPV
jgi:hypothetical protein